MVAELTKPPATVSKPRAKGIDWKPIEEMYLQGLPPEVISKKTGVNSRTISVHMCRRDMYKLQQKAISEGDVEGLSKTTRSKLALAADKLADQLQAPPKSLERQNLYADTLQKTAKTAALVHGWGETSALAVVFAGDLSGKPEQDVIDIESGTNLALNEGEQQD